MRDSTSRDDEIQQHYTRRDLGEAILSALAAAGTDLANLRAEDLAPVDQLHIRGREATVELAQHLGLDATKRVLDVGSGLGGASRYLAQEFGCRVTGLDLTEEYCRIAQMLTDRLGLGSHVVFRQGSALEMPFEDSSFDVVWTQHAAMNIADKSRLYTEISRVLRPGGSLALYDIVAGPGGTPHFPVPWAREPSLSFLVEPEGLRALMEQAGLRVVRWRDTSEAGRVWFQDLAARLATQAGGPLQGIHGLLWPDFREMGQNQVRNLIEDRIVLIEAIAQRLAA